MPLQQRMQEQQMELLSPAERESIQNEQRQKVCPSIKRNSELQFRWETRGGVRIEMENIAQNVGGIWFGILNGIERDREVLAVVNALV